MSSSATHDRRVWVAVSGGVDSSVAAARLAEEGTNPTGVTMRLVDPDVSEAHDAALEAARDVCDALGLRHRIVDLRSEFANRVVETTRTLASAGATPNPCVICNEHVKFGVLLERALTAWSDVLATGHYVRVAADESGTRRIARARDESKDQSYFLYRIAPSALEYLEFPLSESLKTDVTAEASTRDLPVLSRESQDICVPEVFESHAGPAGSFVDPDGVVVGEHDGALAFTIGQRKGLGLAGGPLFVTRVDATTGEVHVGPREDVLRRGVRAIDPVWTHRASEVECTAQIRYRSSAAPARATLQDDGLRIDFLESVEAPAPGQAVVCYEGDVVIGGGVIAETW